MSLWGVEEKQVPRNRELFVCRYRWQEKDKMSLLRYRKACDDHCSCYSCCNSYGKKEESKKDFPSRKRKMVSSPPSLKRTRTSKVLGEQGFEINWGKWTIVEACLLETVESFLCTTNVLPTYQKKNKVVQFCGEQQLCISCQD